MNPESAVGIRGEGVISLLKHWLELTVLHTSPCKKEIFSSEKWIIRML